MCSHRRIGRGRATNAPKTTHEMNSTCAKRTRTASAEEMLEAGRGNILTREYNHAANAGFDRRGSQIFMLSLVDSVGLRCVIWSTAAIANPAASAATRTNQSAGIANRKISAVPTAKSNPEKLPPTVSRCIVIPRCGDLISMARSCLYYAPLIQKPTGFVAMYPQLQAGTNFAGLVVRGAHPAPLVKGGKPFSHQIHSMGVPH